MASPYFLPDFFLFPGKAEIVFFLFFFFFFLFLVLADGQGPEESVTGGSQMGAQGHFLEFAHNRVPFLTGTFVVK